MDQLTTARCRLRRLREDDFDNIRVLESNQAIMRFTSAGAAQTPEQSKQRLANQIAMGPSMQPFGIWVAEKLDGEFVGWFMLKPNDESELEIGFMSVPSTWNKGYVTEVGQALVTFAIKTDPDIEIVAKTTIDNEVSIRVLEKLDFKLLKTEKLVNHFALR
jgi:ribosomal-protein-alanine N-acetyltransferase